MRGEEGDLKRERSLSPLGRRGGGEQPHRKGRRRWCGHWGLPGVADVRKTKRQGDVEDTGPMGAPSPWDTRAQGMAAEAGPAEGPLVTDRRLELGGSCLPG